MTLRSLTLAGALLAGLFAGRAPAQVINTVTSSNDPTADATVSACAGSVLTIDGTGFGTKGKVFLTDGGGKKYTLKASEYTDTHIVATIKKAVAGDLTLNVLPKGSAEPATASVTIEAPAVAGFATPADDDITSADADAEFVIAGHFFGIKKGKIMIGLKKAKILSWVDDAIHVIMPKALANGLWPILLSNKIGEDNDEEITTTNSTAKIGKAAIQFQIDGDPLGFKFTPGAAIPGEVIVYGLDNSNPVTVLTIFIPFDVSSDTAPASFDESQANVVFLQTGKVKLGQIPSIASYAAGLGQGDISILINASSGSQVAGTVDVTLIQESDSFNPPKPATLHLTGSFILEVDG